jgi:hypothetical protein
MLVVSSGMLGLGWWDLVVNNGAVAGLHTAWGAVCLCGGGGLLLQQQLQALTAAGLEPGFAGAVYSLFSLLFNSRFSL